METMMQTTSEYKFVSMDIGSWRGDSADQFQMKSYGEQIAFIS